MPRTRLAGEWTFSEIAARSGLRVDQVSRALSKSTPKVAGELVTVRDGVVRRAFTSQAPDSASTVPLSRSPAMWDAIHDYVRACGGYPHWQCYGVTARQAAVVAICKLVDGVTDGASPSPETDPRGLPLPDVDWSEVEQELARHGDDPSDVLERAVDRVRGER